MSERVPDPQEPWAKRHQLESDELDEQLLARARERHRMCTWWWGHRQTEEGNGALCYICDQLVTTWQRKWPMPVKAKHDVQSHRTEHLTKNLFEDDLQ